MSHVDESQRRWFVDLHPRFRGRLLEVYWIDDDKVSASVHWRNGRPRGTRRSWYGKLSNLLTERLPGTRRGVRTDPGPLRYEEMTGAALERARRHDFRRYVPASEGDR